MPLQIKKKGMINDFEANLALRMHHFEFFIEKQITIFPFNSPPNN